MPVLLCLLLGLMLNLTSTEKKLTSTSTFFEATVYPTLSRVMLLVSHVYWNLRGCKIVASSTKTQQSSEYKGWSTLVLWINVCACACV